MKALLINQVGTLDDVVIGEAPSPRPAAGQVLIETRAVGVNPADWKIVGMGMPDWQFPKVAGLDAAGVVVELGDGVEGLAVGDRVVFHSSFGLLGAYAELCVAPAKVCAKLPEGLSLERAAAMPTAGYTAYMVIVDRFRISAQDSILIHAGAGGLGGFAVQLAKHRGATVLATCSSANIGFVTGLGADHCIDYRSEDVGARVKDLTNGRGVDAILNTISPQIGAEAIPMLAFQGKLACCTGLPDFEDVQPLPRGIEIHDIALGAAHLRDDDRALRRMAEYGVELGGLIATGEIDAMIEEILPFDQIIDALERSRTGHQRGKIVVTL